MTAPFNFPVAYGRLGNWPGTIGPLQAQTVYLHASRMPKGSTFVEYGFDGARTTIVLNWAASDIDAAIISVGNFDSGAQQWLRRASVMYHMQARLKIAGMEQAPLPADLLVFNARETVNPAWVEAVKPEGVIIKIGPHASKFPTDFKEMMITPEISVWQRISNTAAIMDAVTDKVIRDIANGQSSRNPLDNHNVIALHGSSGSGKRSGNRQRADNKIHEGMESGKGSELLSSEGLEN